MTPLQRAVRDGRLELAHVLLERGADPNAAGFDMALPTAVSDGNTEMVRLLLLYGANPNAHPGTTSPLHRALWVPSQQQPELARMLLDHGAAPSARDESGRTPLHLAASFHNREFALMLLQAGARPDATDRQGRVPRLDAFVPPITQVAPSASQVWR